MLMLSIKNDQILLCCHYNEIKDPGTSFQSSALSQKKHVRNVCHTAN